MLMRYLKLYKKHIIDIKKQLCYIIFERTVVLILTISKQITCIIGEENANRRTTQTKENRNYGKML